MALIHKPIKKENVERDWKTTLGLEVIVELLENMFPGFDMKFNDLFKVKADKIKLTDSKVRFTFYSSGKEEVINEIPCKIHTAD